MNKPTLQLALEFDRAVRGDDEWFEEPDELERVQKALGSIEDIDDPTEAAAVVAFRLTAAQGFTEGNKRTALLLARWILDKNGLDGRQILDPQDRKLADLLVHAASGRDVEADIVAHFKDRS